MTLNARGLASLRADGVFGPLTEAAVRHAQLCTGRPRTGCASPADVTAFARYSAPTPERHQ